MRIHLLSAYQQRIALNFLRASAARDPFGVHVLVDSPDAADVVLFVENGEPDDPLYDTLAAHPVVRREWQRTFMYNEWDYPYGLLPGLYASMPRRAFDATRHAACAYLFSPNPLIATTAQAASPRDVLFSFIGARNHPIRSAVLRLSDSRAVVRDTSHFSLWSARAGVTPASAENPLEFYATTVARSQFVLCPRGAGTSSYRLFETLEAGRAPVVIADQWVAPDGPDWSFLVRVPESDVARIPDLLRGLESEARDRGVAARRAWETWFAPDVVFHQMCERIDALRRQGAVNAPSRPRWLDAEYWRVRQTWAAKRAKRVVKRLAGRQ